MSNSFAKFEQHIEIKDSPCLAVDILASNTGLSKQQLKLVMQKGAVWLSQGKKTQRLRRAKKTVQIGEIIHIYYDPIVLAQSPTPPILISDEGYYSLWNKPYGLYSQGSKWGDHCTITRWAEQNLSPERNSFSVHRLDKAANGLILIAHEKSAAAKLCKLFQDRLITKRYRIWVQGHFNKENRDPMPVIVDSNIDERSAISYFTQIEYNSKQERSLLEVSIETGRKHQIRRHSALLGFPVIGDRLYGIDKENEKEDLQLTAYYLAFVCPYSHTQKTYHLYK